MHVRLLFVLNLLIIRKKHSCFVLLLWGLRQHKIAVSAKESEWIHCLKSRLCYFLRMDSEQAAFSSLCKQIPCTATLRIHHLMHVKCLLQTLALCKCLVSALLLLLLSALWLLCAFQSRLHVMSRVLNVDSISYHPSRGRKIWATQLQQLSVIINLQIL